MTHETFQWAVVLGIAAVCYMVYAACVDIVTAMNRHTERMHLHLEDIKDELNRLILHLDNLDAKIEFPQSKQNDGWRDEFANLGQSDE